MEPTSTILIVDDDRDIRTLLADYLESNSYRALCAADGLAMWKMLDEAKPDLVVLDLNLPGDDGLTLCRKLRAHSTLPVIMLTARGEPLDRILGLEMGADDYLPKPFEPRAVSMMTGRVDCARSLRHRVRPSSPGRFRSSTTRSGLASSSIFHMARPSAAHSAR